MARVLSWTTSREPKKDERPSGIRKGGRPSSKGEEGGGREGVVEVLIVGRGKEGRSGMVSSSFRAPLFRSYLGPIRQKER